ncbi:MAG: FdtA/QdtA family cupin domain-containing protein [Bacteroidia bacterium]|nr:FdtA/QdtA family cupin domain-containing protein [Bacteroidia bacterium]
MPSIYDVKWINLKSINDSRGVLTSIEAEKEIPIEIKRIFYMHHVTADRGGHAHMDTDQVIIAISGQFEIEVYDGGNTKKYKMDNPTQGLFVPRMIFINLYQFTKDAVCIVLASTHYDIKKSIRNIENYNKILNVI